MAVTNTTRLNLLKPDIDELANPVTQIAENMQKIDDKVALVGHAHTGATDGPQIQASGLADSAVTDTKIAPTAKTTPGGTEASRLAVTNANGRVGDSEKLGGIAASSVSRRDQAETRTGDLTMGAGIKLTLAADPGGPMEAVTKNYADALRAGLLVKDPVRAATTADIALNGLQTIDGVVLAAGDRVLVKSQATGSQNGIYVAAAGIWSRASDVDTNAKVKAGLYVMVTEGTTYADSGFVLTTNDPITVGTTVLTFTLYANVANLVNGAGLDKTGNVFSVKFPAAGGTNGAADQAARSDHTHTPASIGAETTSGSQTKADTAMEEGLVIEHLYPVPGSDPAQIHTDMGPAYEFPHGVTKSVEFVRRWPFGVPMSLELVIAMDLAANADFILDIAIQINGGAVQHNQVTKNLVYVTNMVTMGRVLPGLTIAQGSVVTVSISRLGGNAADTHTGNLRLYHTRLMRF